MPANYHDKESQAWRIADALRGSVLAEDVYPLVYAARHALKSEARGDSSEESLLDAAEGDADIKAAIEVAIRRLPANCSIDQLLDIVGGLDEDSVNVYLQQAPSSRGIFGGENSTPDGIAKLALALLDINDHDRVIDYGCGKGDFLEMAYAQCPAADYLGVDVNPGVLAVAKMRSKTISSKVDYAVDDLFRYYEENIAGNPVDKAFSNYPWGLRTKNLRGTSKYVDNVLKGQERYGRPSSADWVFNRVLVDSLAADGTAVAIMSDGACFNGVDRRVREYFVKNGFIKAIVALPKGVFAPYTMIPTSLVVLCPGGAKEIRFVDASDLGTSNRRGCSLDDDAVAAIIERMSIDSERSVSKAMNEVAAREYDLSARRYLEKEIEVPNGVALGSLSAITRGVLVKAADLDALFCQEDTGISYLELRNISDGCIDDELPNLKELNTRLERGCVEDGDLLISKSGAPFKVAVAEVPEGRKILVKDNLYIVRVDREKINPYYLAAFFASPLGRETLARGAVGTAIPNVPIRALSSMKVPLESAERQKEVANAYLAKIDEIKVLKLRLNRARQEVTDLFSEEG